MAYAGKAHPHDEDGKASLAGRSNRRRRCRFAVHSGHSSETGPSCTMLLRGNERLRAAQDLLGRIHVVRLDLHDKAVAG